MSAVVFDFYLNGQTLTVEAARNGQPRCVLRADGSEFNVALFGNALGRLGGLRERYLDALATALARLTPKERERG